MNPRAAGIFIGLAVVLAACGGGGRAGDTCSKAGFLCADATGALECRAGTWVRLPCRGPGGCARTNDAISCDMNGNLAGDACASTAEEKGLCSADGKSTLLCRDGTLRFNIACSSCTVAGDQVSCQP